MDLSVSLSAKEVLFHLNYMGYRNVTKEQLKYFMFGLLISQMFCLHFLTPEFVDLKKLIKYESSPRVSTEIHIEAGPSSANIQRLFEAHTITSKTKQKEKPKEIPKPQQQSPKHQAQPQTQRAQQRPRPETIKEVTESDDLTSRRPNSASQARPVRTNSAEASRRPSPNADKPKQDAVQLDKKKPQRQNSEQINKENVTSNVPVAPTKSKMWIRPKSGSQATRKPLKKTDPVSLYHAYQKDWEKFKPNICESSHSDLRWSIREKMMGNR